MKYKLIFLFFLFYGISMYSQNLADDKGVPWKFHFNPHGTMGLVYQKEVLFDLGLKMYFKKKWEMFSICGVAQFQKRDAPYISPALLLSYYKPVKSYFGPVINLEYAHRKI